jgi:hypothetical protein
MDLMNPAPKFRELDPRDPIDAAWIRLLNSAGLNEKVRLPGGGRNIYPEAIQTPQPRVEHCRK